MDLTQPDKMPVDLLIREHSLLSSKELIHYLSSKEECRLVELWNEMKTRDLTNYKRGMELPPLKSEPNRREAWYTEILCKFSQPAHEQSWYRPVMFEGDPVRLYIEVGNFALGADVETVEVVVTIGTLVKAYSRIRRQSVIKGMSRNLRHSYMESWYNYLTESPAQRWDWLDTSRLVQVGLWGEVLR